MQMKKYPMGGAHERARALRRGMTEAETKLWRMLRSRQIEGQRFRRQVPLGRYIADFVCHDARLIVELDGGQHDCLSQQEADRSRFPGSCKAKAIACYASGTMKFWQIPRACTPSSSRTCGGLTPTQPSPIKGEGFKLVTFGYLCNEVLARPIMPVL